MKSPPILQNNDEEAARSASEARAAGEGIIRDHLTNHLEHNKGASSDYISWIATLHPENAEICIDQRFLMPGNPWWTIYDDTVNQMPYATAVAVPVAGEDSVESANSSPAGDPTCEKDSLSTEEGSTLSESPITDDPKSPHYILLCSPFDLLIGLLTTFHAILGTTIMEVVALVFYFIASVFYHFAEALGSPNIFNRLFISFFMTFYFSFALADSVVLFASVMVTEVLNLISWVLGCLFGGIWVANRRHQYIRRVCHHVRWAFRRAQLHPARSFCSVCRTEKHEGEEENRELDAEDSTIQSGVVHNVVGKKDDIP